MFCKTLIIVLRFNIESSKYKIFVILKRNIQPTVNQKRLSNITEMMNLITIFARNDMS